MEAGTPQASTKGGLMMKPSKKGKILAEGVTLRSVSDHNQSIKGIQRQSNANILQQSVVTSVKNLSTDEDEQLTTELS